MTEDLEIPAGGVLCKEGETGQEFFVIVDGKIEVTRKGRRLAARGGGDFVGEIALLEDVPRTATVKAKTGLRVFVLTRKDFRHLIDENPSVERKVMRALARRVMDLSRTRRWRSGALLPGPALVLSCTAIRTVARGAREPPGACAHSPMGLGSPGYLLGELPWPPELLQGT